MPWYSTMYVTPEETKRYEDEFLKWLERSYISRDEYALLSEFHRRSLLIAFEDQARTYNRRELYKLPFLSKAEEIARQHQFTLEDLKAAAK